MEIPNAGDEKALRANAASYAAAIKTASAMAGGGEVVVNRMASGAVVVWETYTISAPPAKKAKLDTACAAKDPREVWKTSAFGAKAKVMEDIGAGNVEAVLKELFPEKKNKAPAKMNFDQSLAWKLFSLLNKAEQAQVVPGSTASILLPDMKNYKKFLEKARAHVGRLPVDEMAADGGEDGGAASDGGNGGSGEGEAEAEDEAEAEAEAEDGAASDEEVEEDEE